MVQLDGGIYFDDAVVPNWLGFMVFAAGDCHRPRSDSNRHALVHEVAVKFPPYLAFRAWGHLLAGDFVCPRVIRLFQPWLA